MHQQPPKMPLLRSTRAANAAHVDSSRALTVYPGSTTEPSLGAGGIRTPGDYGSASAEAGAHVFQTTSIRRSTPGRGRAPASASTASRVRATGVPRRRSARRAAHVSRFRGSRRRRGARPATPGTSRAAPADPPAGREAPAPLRRAGSRHRRSATGARARRPSRRRASPARRLRAATRRRAATARATAILRARRTRRPPSSARCRPSGRSSQPWSARRRGGSAGRARGMRRPVRSSAAGTVQTIGARAPSQRIAIVPVVAAYLSELPTPSARPSSRSVIRRPSRWACIRSAIRSARRRLFALSGSLPSENSAKSRFGDDVGAVARPPQLGERGILPRRRLDPVDPRVQREQRGSRHAVLQAGPRRPPQRLRARRQPLVEPTDPSSERQDLPPREPESRLHRNRPASLQAHSRRSSSGRVVSDALRATSASGVRGGSCTRASVGPDGARRSRTRPGGRREPRLG